MSNIKTCFTGQHKDLLHLCTFKIPHSVTVMCKQSDDDCLFKMHNGVKNISVDFHLDFINNESHNWLNDIIIKIFYIFKHNNVIGIFSKTYMFFNLPLQIEQLFLII